MFAIANVHTVHNNKHSEFYKILLNDFAMVWWKLQKYNSHTYWLFLIAFSVTLLRNRM